MQRYRRLSWLLRAGSVLLWSALLASGCEEAGTDSAPPDAHVSPLVGATAPSTHYVRVTFAGARGARALEAARYIVSDARGVPLPVHEARPDGDGVLLVTGAQRDVVYRLHYDHGEAAADHDAPEGLGTHQGALHATVNFAGSTLSEGHLVGATALDNTHVMLVFSEMLERNAGNPAFFSVESPNLDVLAAVVTSDRKGVLLTTSPQEALAYTVRVHGLKTNAGNQALLDPFRSSAVFEGRLNRDDTAPTLVGATAIDNSLLLLTFSEALDADAADVRNFSISPDLLVISASLRSFDTQVLLETAPMIAGVEYTVTAGPGVRDVARNPIGDPASATFESPILSDGDSEPAVVGAVSTGNTRVVVRFSKPMDDAAIDASNYSIVQENVHSEAGFVGVLGAEFVDDRRVSVALTTYSQTDVTYRVKVSNVADLAGNPLLRPYVSQGVLVDPTSAVFAGTPPSVRDGTLVDSDGDGLNDNIELRGWIVTVRGLDGATREHEVTSDPGDPRLDVDDPANVLARDTDDDGLDDATEHLLATDPRRPDTDGDTLDDNEEFNVIFTDPAAVDSDEDGIDDSLEVAFFKTNALEADSDGDGYDDGDELFARHRDPRLADLPEHTVEIGAVRLRIDERFTYTDEEGATVTDESSTTTALNTSEGRTTVTMSGATRTISGGAEFGLDTCQDGCDKLGVHVLVNRLFAKGHIEAGAEFLEQTDTESARAAEEAFERSLTKGAERSSTGAVTREVAGASVQVEVTLRNPGSVAISLSNLALTLRTTDPEDPTRLVPVATLVPESTLLTGEPAVFNIGPGDTRGPIVFANTDVFPSMVEDLMRAPRGLVAQVANFDVVTGDDRNFAFGLQNVRERTVGLVIDAGDGEVRRVQAIAAGVLNRERDDLRCAPHGDQADMPCAEDADCGNSAPCTGGAIVGGFAGFAGTGPVRGIPLDFVLQDTVGLRRARPQAILAGEDGVADTAAAEGDVQVVPVGTAGLGPNAVVVAAGRDLRLQTAPAGDDLNPTAPDGLLAGPDGVADSIARGDDVQLVPVGTRGLPEDTVVVSAGEDGELSASARGDDVADVVTGYEVSGTCGADTPFRILAGPNRVVETAAVSGTCVRAFAPHFVGERCLADADCGVDGVCTADVQTNAVGATLPGANSVAVTPGGSGFLSSVPRGDDLFLGPGVPCTADADCRAPGLAAGACDGAQKIVRVGSRRDGQFQRFWTLILPDNVQYQTDFSLIQVRPGDLIALKFVQDVDRDGLISEEEFLAGSSDFERDTDGDTLDDFAEVRVGWEVGAIGGAIRRVYPDPRTPDSDGDGLFDYEEIDFRPLRCTCDATGPKSVVGTTGTPCATDDDCGGGACLDAASCDVGRYLAGEDCLPCGGDASRSRTDPRATDTDGDAVGDHDELFSYLTGAGVGDAYFADVVLAGADRVAGTRACPQNHCAGDPARHCDTDADCRNRQCVRPAPCDDVQVVPHGSGGWDPRTVVVAPGVLFDGATQRAPLESARADGDLLLSGGDGVGASRLAGDDVVFAGEGERAYDTGLALTCVDGSTFTADGVVARFPLCGLVKPGPDGALQTRPGGDDVIVPAGRGQRREFTDPLDPDTDRDGLRDGVERLAGSSPNDPGDTGIAGDLDEDGLTDGQETNGWTVSRFPLFGGAVNTFTASNPYVPDTDLDGLPDHAERHMPCGDAPGAECPIDPTNPDTDGDGLTDFDELSAAKFAQLEGVNGFFPAYAVDGGASAQHGTDPRRADTDGDGVSDFDELFRPVTVVLPDGSRREVTSDPTASDTDGDGAADATERSRFGGASDPADPDTDDDGKLDGREISVGSDPLTPDIIVTVTFRRIEIDSVEDTSGAEDPDFMWWFLARAPGLAQNPTLVSSARKFGADDRDTDGDGFTDNGGDDGYLVYRLSDTDVCHFIPVPQANRHTLFLDQGVSFPLRRGESFVVEGMLAEIDPGTTNDCGRAPNYMPSGLRSSCYTRFSETYDYADLAQGERGETLALNPGDAQAEGGDSCAWQVIGSIVVE